MTMAHRDSRTALAINFYTGSRIDHRIGESILRSEHIAVVGTGQMGRGIAQLFAFRGHEVVLFDRDEDALDEAIVKIQSNLIDLSEHGLCLREEIERTIEQIKPVCSLKEAVASARFVVESAEEELEVKQDLFHQMEQLCSPITILATNGSLIRVTEAAAKTKVKERVIGTHFWAPPYLIPLVEVVGGRETSREVKEYTCNILKSVGKYPVMVEKDVPGLVGSRLQLALQREAIAIVEQGIADADAVNKVVKKGLSLRLYVSGPLENVESAGTDQTFQVYKHLLKVIGRFY